ncbi:LuxR family transcriptional regulator, partial [Bacteroides pyogenes]
QHAVYGKSETERRAEAFHLIKVYRYFQDRDRKENDILIGGDFNLSAFDEAFSPLYEDKDQIIYGIDPNIKTTIGMKKMANSYDNIFLSKIYTQEFTGKSGAVDFTNRDYKVMRNKVSDHLPIFIIVNVDRDDD